MCPQVGPPPEQTNMRSYPIILSFILFPLFPSTPTVHFLLSISLISLSYQFLTSQFLLSVSLISFSPLNSSYISFSMKSVPLTLCSSCTHIHFSCSSLTPVLFSSLLF